MSDKPQGLVTKYVVRKVEDNSLVEGCFVLRPDKDPAAASALLAYADATSNGHLAQDIHTWLKVIGYNYPQSSNPPLEVAPKKQTILWQKDAEGKWQSDVIAEELLPKLNEGDFFVYGEVEYVIRRCFLEINDDDVIIMNYQMEDETWEREKLQ